MAKRWIPALFLWVATSGACAQGASSFMQGVSLRIGFKDGDNVVIPNAPFQADVVVLVSATLADGNLLKREVRGKVQRDTAGRFRWEGVETGSDGTPKSNGFGQSIILDPVAKQTLTWGTVTKDVHASSMMDNRNVDLQYAGFADGREHLRKDPPDDVTTKDLGIKKIGGLECSGTLVTTVVPVGKMGNEKPIVITDESWRSADLHMVVERIVKDPLIGTRDVTFQNITRSEPNASAFKVPDGYNVHRMSLPPPGVPPVPGAIASPNY